MRSKYFQFYAGNCIGHINNEYYSICVPLTIFNGTSHPFPTLPIHPTHPHTYNPFPLLSTSPTQEELLATPSSLLLSRLPRQAGEEPTQVRNNDSHDHHHCLQCYHHTKYHHYHDYDCN